jgi:hypothetical protein
LDDLRLLAAFKDDRFYDRLLHIDEVNYDPDWALSGWIKVRLHPSKSARQRAIDHRRSIASKDLPCVSRRPERFM